MLGVYTIEKKGLPEVIQVKLNGTNSIEDTSREGPVINRLTSQEVILDR